MYFHTNLGGTLKWTKTATRVMEFEQFAGAYIESHPDDISKDGLIRLGTASLDQVRQLQKVSPDASRAYAGNNLYTIVVASYDAQAKQLGLATVCS